MFNKLIIGTDTSPAARTLLDCVNGFRQFGTTDVVLVESSNLTEGYILPTVADSRAVEMTLEEQKKLLERNGFQVESKLINEPLKKTMTGMAEQNENALIIVGAEKQSRTRDMLFGGLAYDIIHHTANPVLILRLYKPEESHKLRNCDFGSHVLFPTDFSPNAERAFTYLEKLVMTEADKVTLLHVWHSQRITETGINVSAQTQAEKHLASMKEKLLAAKPDLEVDTLVIEGNPFREIRRLVEELSISLVVMGSQGTGYISDLFVGSLTHNVVRNVDSSVLIIPAERRKAQRTDVRDSVGR
ncbi:MAG TPA: universal stress protein [Clostridiaceae bacterium]|nr:universal stress protein [Clostridiaceae bacterium]